MKHIWKRTTAASLALLLVTSPLPSAAVGNGAFSSVAAVQASAAEEKVLTLRGEISSIRMQMLSQDVKDSFTKIVVAEGAVFPEDSGGLFSSFTTVTAAAISTPPRSLTRRPVR